MSAPVTSAGVALGVALFLLSVLPPGLGLSSPQKVVLGTALWMAAWWISGAVPLYVTAFLPLLVFPAAQIAPFAEIAASYADRLVFLLMGGFILAKAIEKTGLHERFALTTLKVLPSRKPAVIVAAFMLVTASVSAWLCNTATTLMILPIALAVVSQVKDPGQKGVFASCLMLSVAYAAGLGGIITLVGTPPNALCSSIAGKALGAEISFFRWFLVGAPIAVVGLVIVGWYMTHIAFPMSLQPAIEDEGELNQRLEALGRMPRAQKLVGGVFAATAVAWLSHAAWKPVFPMLDDAMIALLAATALFLLPSGEPGRRVLEAEDGLRIPWGVLLVIGGGIALAVGFQSTGLDAAIAMRLVFLNALPLFVVMSLLAAIALIVTQFVVNTATAALLLPVAASLAQTLQVDPVLLLVPVTIATSLGFILPIGTPPNMVVLGTDYVTTKQMARAGIPLTFILWVVVSILLYWILPVVFEFR
ncbi:MAG: SLC13/DASS family transporter [Polyangiaceae bacterium]|nr:SLC13/DASS family transporter [Polyangiaceae bacterium]